MTILRRALRQKMRHSQKPRQDNPGSSAQPVYHSKQGCNLAGNPGHAPEITRQTREIVYQSPEIRTHRVLAVKEALAQGEYHIDLTALAHRMVLDMAQTAQAAHRCLRKPA